MTTAAQIIREFDNGAKIVEFSDGVRVGVDHGGRVYWATPAGWDFVMDSGVFAEETFKIWGDSTGWPTVHDSDFFIRVRASASAGEVATP